MRQAPFPAVSRRAAKYTAVAIMSPNPDSSEGVEDQSTVQKVSFIERYVRHIRPVGDLAPAVLADAWVPPSFPVNWQVSKDLRAKKHNPFFIVRTHH